MSTNVGTVYNPILQGWAYNANILTATWLANQSQGFSGATLAYTTPAGLTPTLLAGAFVSLAGSIAGVSYSWLYDVPGEFWRLKFTLTLTSAPAIKTFSFPAAISGLATLVQNADGSLSLTQEGYVLATIPKPYATDANTTRRPLGVSLAAGVITLTLNDTGLVYPLILDPTTIGTTTFSTPVDTNSSPHIFTMADGNEVAIYYDGTNLVYRIKSGGTWGAATTIVAFATVSAWCRNGDTMYGVTANAAIPTKLAYSGGSITKTSGSSIGSIVHTYGIDAYWDSTNSYFHLWVAFGGTCPTTTIFAYDTTLTQKYSSQFDSANEKPGRVAGDGTSTFYVGIWNGTAAFQFNKYVAGATSYTITSPTAPAGLTNSQTGNQAAHWDGSKYVYIDNDSGALKVNSFDPGGGTWSGWSTIVSANVAQEPPTVIRKGSTDLLAVIYRNNANQANGEIYYIRRSGGAWGTATALATGAGGYDRPSVDKTDTNVSNTALLVYTTGTASPWNVVEDSFSLVVTFTQTIAATSTSSSVVQKSVSHIFPTTTSTSVATLTEVKLKFQTITAISTSVATILAPIAILVLHAVRKMEQQVAPSMQRTDIAKMEQQVTPGMRRIDE